MQQRFSNWSKRRKVIVGAALAGFLLVAGGTTGALAATGAFGDHSCTAVVGPDGEVATYGDCGSNGQELGELQFQGEVPASESGMTSGTFPSNEKG